MYVCICKNVTDRDIRHAVASGCSSFAQVQACTGAGTKCGKCTRFAKLEVEEARRDLQAEESRYGGSLVLAPMGA
jgi:bacterioferritin-associated ferredoxin